MDRQVLGRQGEELAARYYLDRGWTLLARNYRTRLGELDLVVQRKGLVAIAEVKARGARRLAEPAESVGAAKQARLTAAALQFLAQRGLSDCPVRFDVVEVTPRPQGGYLVHCIPDAFRPGG